LIPEQQSTTLSKTFTNFANVWMRAFRPMVDIMSTLWRLWTGCSRLLWHNFVTVGD